MLQILAQFQAVLLVPRQLGNRVSVQRQLRQLLSIFERLDLVEALYFIVGKEDSLEPRAILEPVDRVDLVPPQVQLG